MDKISSIDNLDRQILSIVMHNARIPSKDIAQECGVSRAAIHQRIQRMIELGIITGSGYTVNPKLLGYSTCTYIGVNLERGAMYKDVVPELEKIPEVIECHFTTGPYTMLIKLFVRDNEHLTGAAQQKDTDDQRRDRNGNPHLARQLNLPDHSTRQRLTVILTPQHQSTI